MEVVDTKIAAAFLDLANFFAEKNGFETISSLVNLWSEHGKLIINLMEIESEEIKTSSDFYYSLFRKLKFISSSLAEGLDPEKAANGNLMEICKFYSLHLEYLRNMQAEMLKKVLEHLANDKKFDKDSLLNMFEKFDKIYKKDCADDWWSFMRVKEKDALIGLVTPTIKRQNSIFTTPKAPASTRRMLTCASAKRSPIVEIVDSPTMKFVRAERELKQFTKKLIDVEIKLEEAENENLMLLKENRLLKSQIADHKINVANDRVDVKKAEEKIEECLEELKLKTIENESLKKELLEFRQSIRALQRQIEELDKENNQMSEKIESLTKFNENMSISLRKARESNEANYTEWQQREQELTKQTKCLASERENLADDLSNANRSIDELKGNIKRMEGLIEQKDLDLGWSRKIEEELQEEKKREMKRYEESIESLKAQKDQEIEREMAARKMAEITVERLNCELQFEKNEKKTLKNLLTSLEQKNLKETLTDHEEKEKYLKTISFLTAGKSKIEILEAEMVGKDAQISSLNSQLKSLQSMLTLEKSIAEDVEKQSKTKIKTLEDQLQTVETKLGKEIEKYREDLAITRAKCIDSEVKYEVDVVVKKKLVDEQKQTIFELKKKNEELEANNCEMMKKIQYFQGLVGGCKRNYSFSSVDSLYDAIDKELKNNNENVVTENCVDTTRKSTAFSIDMDLRNQMPRGFKLDSAKKGSETPLKRFSLADETFERGKFERMSIRSDCVGSMSSPSGNEEKLKRKRNKMRQSLSAFTNVFGKK